MNPVRSSLLLRAIMNIFGPEYIAIAVVALYFTLKLARSEPEEKQKKHTKEAAAYRINHPRRGGIPGRG